MVHQIISTSRTASSSSIWTAESTRVPSNRRLSWTRPCLATPCCLDQGRTSALAEDLQTLDNESAQNTDVTTFSLGWVLKNDDQDFDTAKELTSPKSSRIGKSQDKKLST